MKEDWYEAEHEWKEVFYKDLDLQLWLRFIEYVHIHAAQSIHPVSKEYIEEQTALYRSRKKTNAAVMDDFHHFLMYETRSCATIDRCKEKPNELWRLI